MTNRKKQFYFELMNYLLNIYEFGNIIKTEIHESEENALQSFNKHVDNIESQFEKACASYSCTPTKEEIQTKTNNKKTNK